MFEKIKKAIETFMHFLRVGIWKVDVNKSSKLRGFLYTCIKSVILAYRNMQWTELNNKASALTYNTLLSIIPLLAVLFAIANGFGFQNIVKSELFSYFEGQKDILERSMAFIDNSLQYAQSGVFLGIGVILLFYTVINLIGGIETNFNAIWKIKNDRSYYRQLTDYTALIIIAPIFLICNAGLSVILNSSAEQKLLGLVLLPFIELLPYIIIVGLFTFLYLYIPNTKVKFTSALFAGVIAGLSFQLFQQLYISGQIWISKYNAIYGSFAALPLLLLWLQISWLIVLIGVELSFGYQNVKKFNYEKDAKNISRRYKDFVILLIVTLIVKRFEKGECPYTASEISERFQIPTRITNDAIFLLQDLNIITETPSKEKVVPAYLPALDINKISVAYLFGKIDSHGSEDIFNIDINGEFFEEWNIIQDIRRTVFDKQKDILVKNL